MTTKEPYWIAFDIAAAAGRIDNLEIDLSRVERVQTTREGVWPEGHRFQGHDKIIKLLFRYEGEILGIDSERPGANPDAAYEFHEMWIKYMHEHQGGLEATGQRMEPQSTLIQAAGMDFNVSPIVKA